MDPHAAAQGNGRVEHLLTTPEAGAPMVAHRSVTAVAGQGLDGDRYLLGTGTYSAKPHEDRHLTIIEAEVLAALEAETGIVLTPQETRRNLVSSGIPLNDLVGRRLRIGSVVVHAGRLNKPCKYLEEVTGKAVFRPLIGRSGLNCQILEGGELHVGDAIVPLD